MATHLSAYDKYLQWHRRHKAYTTAQNAYVRESLRDPAVSHVTHGREKRAEFARMFIVNALDHLSDETLRQVLSDTRDMLDSEASL